MFLTPFYSICFIILVLFCHLLTGYLSIILFYYLILSSFLCLAYSYSFPIGYFLQLRFPFHFLSVLLMLSKWQHVYFMLEEGKVFSKDLAHFSIFHGVKNLLFPYSKNHLIQSPTFFLFSQKLFLILECDTLRIVAKNTPPVPGKFSVRQATQLLS